MQSNYMVITCKTKEDHHDLSRSQIKNTRWYFVGDTVGVVDDLKLNIMRFKLLVSECMVY